MKQSKSYSFYLVFFTICFLLFGSCTPKQSYKLKSFLFDGVPAPAEVGSKADSLIQGDSLKIDNLVPATTKVEMKLHPPYQARECADCHNRNQMGKLRLALPDLCYECHENFNDMYPILHGPVASGYCTECHNPHQSKFDDLLTRPGQELCLSCHDPASILEGKIHKGIDNTNCTECHNPHGGDNNFMLQTNICYKCHENFENKYTFLHGPVASQNCSVCHGSHSTKSDYLLLKPGDDLCLSCHNNNDVKDSPYHQSNGILKCVNCHNPHGGSTHNLLLN